MSFFILNCISEFVKSKSAAAAGLCAWVINIIKFYEVFCDVEPKRKALAAANAELAAATEKLKAIKSKVAVSKYIHRFLIIFLLNTFIK